MKKRGGEENNTTFAKLLREVVAIVNYIQSHSKKCRIFSKLSEEMDASFTQLLLHKVQWLSKGKVLSRIFLLQDELGVFLLKSMTNGLVNFVTIFGGQKLHIWPPFLNTSINLM